MERDDDTRQLLGWTYVQEEDGECAEAVGEPCRDPEGAVVPCLQFDAGVLAEGGRFGPDVDRNIKDRAVQDPYKLALGLRLDLEVETSNRAG